MAGGPSQDDTTISYRLTRHGWREHPKGNDDNPWYFMMPKQEHQIFCAFASPRNVSNTAKSTRKARQDICSMRPRNTFAQCWNTPAMQTVPRWGSCRPEHGSCGGKSGCSIATANQRVGLGLHVSSSFWMYPDVLVGIHWVHAWANASACIRGMERCRSFKEYAYATRRVLCWMLMYIYLANGCKWWKSAYPTLPTQRKFTLLPSVCERLRRLQNIRSTACAAKEFPRTHEVGHSKKKRCSFWLW